MRGHSNGVRGLASPDRGEKRGGTTGNNNSIHPHSNKNNNNNNSSHHNDNHYQHGGGGGGSGSSGNAHDDKKGGSSSGGDTIAAVWPPKFVIALTNKEKEEDFMAIKGSKLPQRPKKRAKFIQRTLNVSLIIIPILFPSCWILESVFWVSSMKVGSIVKDLSLVLGKELFHIYFSIIVWS